MWDRKDLKVKAKPAFKANYWVSVLAGLILTIFTAAASSSGRNAESSSDDFSTSGIAAVFVLAVVLGILAIVLIIEIVKIIVGNALIVGAQKVFIENATNDEKTKFGTIGFVFSNGHWKNVAITMFLRDLFIALWTLLLVIPGIIKSYEYRMVSLLLAENPELGYKEALQKSKEMMDGHKWNAFVLDLSFIGWFILSALTLNVVGWFYAYPYYYQTNANLYLALKK